MKILNIRADCSKKANSQYRNKISLENINCTVIVILLYQKSDEPVLITGVLDGQIIITLSTTNFSSYSGHLEKKILSSFHHNSSAKCGANG